MSKAYLIKSRPISEHICHIGGSFMLMRYYEWDGYFEGVWTNKTLDSETLMPSVVCLEKATLDLSSDHRSAI